jgi:hypothetical protein
VYFGSWTISGLPGIWKELLCLGDSTGMGNYEGSKSLGIFVVPSFVLAL